METGGREIRTVRVSGSTSVVTERRENWVSACVASFAVTVCRIFPAITAQLERVFVGRSFLLTDTTVRVTNRGRQSY